jgi:hypothetical protein
MSLIPLLAAWLNATFSVMSVFSIPALSKYIINSAGGARIVVGGKSCEFSVTMHCLHLSFSVSQLLAFGAANLVFTLSYASLSIKIWKMVNYKKQAMGYGR